MPPKYRLAQKKKSIITNLIRNVRHKKTTAKKRGGLKRMVKPLLRRSVILDADVFSYSNKAYQHHPIKFNIISS